MSRFIYILFAVCLFCSGLTVQASTLSERQYRLLEKAQELVAEESYQEALAETQDAVDDWDPGLGLVLILQLRGQVYQLLDETEETLKSYERALSLEVLEGTRRSALAAAIAQLYLIDSQPEKAREVLVPALEAPAGEGLNHAAQAYVIVAISYQTQERWRDSLAWLVQAEAYATSIPENWLAMRAAAEFQISDFAAAEVTMKRLVERAPDKKNYWVQLAAAQQFQEKQAQQLATLEIAHQRGLIAGSSEELLMIQLQAAQDMPARAARNLEQRISELSSVEGNSEEENLDDERRLLSAYQRQARDLALAAETMVSNDSSSVNEAIQLAMMDGNCDLVQELSRSHVRKLEGLTMISVAQCSLNDRDTASAREWFQRASEKSDSAVIASQWLTYLSDLQKAGLR
jgi:tetratricopeptide (TPR) repeat protein